METDALANRHWSEHVYSGIARHFACYRLCFDGSVSPTGAGGGWILYSAETIQEDEPHEWFMVASCPFEMPADATVTVCELEACLFGVAFMGAVSRGEGETCEYRSLWHTLKVKNLKILKLAEMLL